MDQINGKEKGTDMLRKYENIMYPPLVPENIQHHFGEIRNMEVRPDDIFVASYPRSGTHWTGEIVKMLRNGRAEYNQDAGRQDAIDFNPISSFKDLDSPRLIFTHLRSKYLPKDITKCSVLYVSRNPKDVLVSLYCLHLNSKHQSSKKDWKQYFQEFVEGECGYGSWFDHARDYFSLAHESDNIHIVKYEDLKRDLRKGVKRIADFLAVAYNENLINDIAEACDFESLKADRNKNIGEDIKALSNTGDNFHYRKGQVGDWKNWFTVAQNELFDEIYKERMKDIGLNFDYSLS